MSNDKTVKVLLHERLRALRQQCNLSQRQVADALGLDRSTYTYYEIGRSQPNLDIIGSICEIYKISVSDLIDVKGLPYGVDDSGDYSVPGPEGDKLCELSSKEQDLLLMFRRLPAQQRNEIIETMRPGIPAPVLPSRGRKRTKKSDD